MTQDQLLFFKHLVESFDQYEELVGFPEELQDPAQLEALQNLELIISMARSIILLNAQVISEQSKPMKE